MHKDIDPKMIANNIEPFGPTHPGELLRDSIYGKFIDCYIFYFGIMVNLFTFAA